VFLRQIRQVRRGAASKVRACTRFLGYACMPMGILELAILGLVVLEERFELVLVSEDMARMALPMLAIGGAEVATLAIVLVTVLSFVSPTRGTTDRR
jgi:hypothetical protein